MIIIHASTKLLNTSRLPAVAFVTKPDEGQLLHSWYASTFSSTFPGKLMTVYIHEPSMMAVVCKGKTIKNTWPSFVERLPGLLGFYGFSDNLIKQEMQLVNDYVVAKTSNRSIVACINQVISTLEHNCSRCASYDDISTARLEEILSDSLYATKERRKYFSAQRYWDAALKKG